MNQLNHTNSILIFLQKHLMVDQSISTSYEDTCHKSFCILGIIMGSGTQDIELTKSMLSTGYCLQNNDLIYLMNFVCTPSIQTQ